MGLDLVEVTIHIEEKFGLNISDEDAAEITTPRELVDYLMTRTELVGKYSRSQVATIVWEVLAFELGIERNSFNEDSRFIEDMGAE